MGRMQAYDLRFANFQAILRRSRYEEDLPEKESTILYLPTESDAASLEVLGRLRDRKIVGPGQVRVFCSITKKTLYESRPEVSEVVTYESGQTLSNLRTILRLARMRVGVLAAIFSGRPVFRLHKLMFLLLPARARLVFNEHRDCWYLRRTPRGLVNLWRTPSLRFSRWDSSILFLPTESDAASLEVLGRLRDRKIVGPGQVRVFCSITKKTLYESRPEVSEVVTYESGQTLSNLRTILKLARMRVDVLAAIFSGRPVFRLHKLMFLLLPARARLVFNEHRDCWYLRRTPRGLVICGELRRCQSVANSVVAVLQVGLLDPVSADRVGRCFSGGSGTAPGPEDRGSRPGSSVLSENESDTLRVPAGSLGSSHL